MTLTTGAFGDAVDVDAETLDEVLRSDGFGQFAVLSSTDEEFLQAGNNWQAGEACQRFLEANDSDPWVLEYREAGTQFQADGDVTLDQVRMAFRSYLAGEGQWRTSFVWSEIEV